MLRQLVLRFFCLTLLVSCGQSVAPRDGTSQTVVLVLGGDQENANVKGSAEYSPAERFPPSGEGLAGALFECGQRDFTLDLASDREAVSFPSSTRDRAVIKCVASKVSFSFGAFRSASGSPSETVPITEI
jgi:hypothetical protein